VYESDETLVDNEDVYESDASESDPYDSDESYDATDEVFDIDDEIGLDVLREEAKEVRAAAAAAAAEEEEEDEEVDDEEEEVTEKSKSKSKRKRKSQSQSQSQINKKKKKSTWTEPSTFDPGPEIIEHVRKALEGNGPTILKSIIDVSKSDNNNNCFKHTLQLTQYSFSYTPARRP
jgi:FKBP-type peptidyl-prolyl cis-trans isomerase